MAKRSSRWEGLRLRLVNATAIRGEKAALARELGVHRQSVGLWLSESAVMPSAETTLHLLEWVKAAEAQQKTKRRQCVNTTGAKNPNQEIQT